MRHARLRSAFLLSLARSVGPRESRGACMRVASGHKSRATRHASYVEPAGAWALMDTTTPRVVCALVWFRAPTSLGWIGLRLGSWIFWVGLHPSIDFPTEQHLPGPALLSLC